MNDAVAVLLAEAEPHYHAYHEPRERSSWDRQDYVGVDYECQYIS